MKVKMKNIVNILVAALLLACSACSDFLNVDHLLQDRRDLRAVFESKDYSNQWLAGVYAHLEGSNADVASKDFNPFNFISDDMLYFDRTKLSDGDRNCAYFKSGSYNEWWEQGSWNSCYTGIRDASIFIHNIDINKGLTREEIIDKKAQARFLRAYFYWLLLRKYGPIPLLPDEGLDFNEDYSALAIPRSSYEECVDFITSELALAARDLPAVGMRSNMEIACPTRGAALAARAKVYLFGASPLFNGNDDEFARQLVDHEGRRLISSGYSEEKWAKAAAAAKEVMDLNVYELHTVPYNPTSIGNMKKSTDPDNGSAITFDYYLTPKTIDPPYHPVHSEANFPAGWKNIDPCESYRQLFNGEVQAYANKELIFTRGQNQSTAGLSVMSLHQMPRSLGGWNAHGLTLKMYDAYHMNDGSDFDTQNRPAGFTDTRVNGPNKAPSHYQNYPPLPPNVSLQNANREPRFYASVAYNGAIWENEFAPITENKRYSQVFYYRDGNDGKDATGFYLRTGIGVKKYYHRYDTHIGGMDIWKQKVEPAIRYAEVLLIYAEALNELSDGRSYSIPAYDGNGVVTVSRDIDAISGAVTQVRVRAGLPDYDRTTVYPDRDVLRKKLKREWQIEFMGEGHRYFDLRRWKDAPVEESQLIEGFNMNMLLSQRNLWHIPVETTFIPAVFSTKMYLWPISHSELKRNRKLTQNPGWTYFEE
jgi:hypothetical protein